MRYFFKNIKSSIAPGCLIGLMLSLGYIVKNEHSVRMNPVFACAVLLTAAFSVIMVNLFYCIIDGLTENKNGSLTERKRMQNTGTEVIKIPFPNRVVKKAGLYYLICFVLLLILWFPSLLALYPGLYTYDAPWQYWMYCDGAVSEQQPLIHTYIMSIILDKMYEITGEFNKGVLVCSIVQMLIMSAGCAYAFYVFYKEKVHTVFHIIAFVFWGLYPPFAIFVFTMTKDSIFAVAVMDFAVINYRLLKDGRRFFDRAGNMVLWGIFAMAVLMLRSNAVYAMLVFLPFWLTGVLRRAVSGCGAEPGKDGEICETASTEKTGKYIVRTVLMVIVTILIFCVYKYPVSSALRDKSTPKCEMLSVPTQQIARVYNYHYDELSEEEIRSIEAFFEDAEILYSYQPQIADNVKGDLDEAYYTEHKGEFISLWIKLGCRYPLEYIDSFMENTYAFWYPLPKYVIFSDGGVSYTNMTSTYPVEQNTKLKALFDFYMQFENGNIVSENNPVSALFSPALFLYIFIFVFFYSIKKKNAGWVTLMFPLLLWMTFLLGPVAQVRYIIFMMALFPVMHLFMRGQRL